MDKYGVAYCDNAVLHPNYRNKKPLVITASTEKEAVKIADDVLGIAFFNFTEKNDIDMNYVFKNRLCNYGDIKVGQRRKWYKSERVFVVKGCLSDSDKMMNCEYDDGTVEMHDVFIINCKSYIYEE